MRPVMHGDVVAAARFLYALPEQNRYRALRRLMQQAEDADFYRRQTGKVHPAFGDGSLMTAALAKSPPSEPALDDRDYCGCMAMVFEALVGLVRRGAVA